jgi:Fe-S-cluster containining protein
LLDDGSILPFVDGRCPHLSDQGRCGIYETRPQGCRDFDCSREPGYLRTHPRVAALLSVHGVPVRCDLPPRSASPPPTA